MKFIKSLAIIFTIVFAQLSFSWVQGAVAFDLAEDGHCAMMQAENQQSSEHNQMDCCEDDVVTHEDGCGDCQQLCQTSGLALLQFDVSQLVDKISKDLPKFITPRYASPVLVESEPPIIS